MGLGNDWLSPLELCDASSGDESSSGAKRLNIVGELAERETRVLIRTIHHDAWRIAYGAVFADRLWQLIT